MGATLTSDEPLRVDLELRVTRPGDITVLLWESGYETGVGGEPMTVVVDTTTGDPNAVSMTTLRNLSASVATRAFAEQAGNPAWVRPRAALVDEIHSDAATQTVFSSACCSPNLTDHVRRPFASTDPANLYLTRNGTHEWVPNAEPPNLPETHLALELGREDDDALNRGMTFDKVVALRAAVAAATYSSEFDVTVPYSGDGRPKHSWKPSVVLHGYAASNFNADLPAGILRRDVVREAVARALGLQESSVSVVRVADEPQSERVPASPEGTCRFDLAVRDVLDPAEVERAWASTDSETFLEDAKARMHSNALWKVEGLSGRRGPNVTAAVTAVVKPKTAGSWVRVANGGGVEPRDLNAAMDGASANERVLVTSVTREYVPNSESSIVFHPPGLNRIQDAPPTPNTVLDVVHRSGSARRMTALVVRFDVADATGLGYHAVRVSFHNQRPGVETRVAVLDGSAGGDAPWFSRTRVALSYPPSPPPAPAPPPKVSGLDTRIAKGPEENSVSPPGTSFEFLFEPRPGCETCGMPAGTTVHARVAKEPALAYGDWKACTAVDVEEVVRAPGGLNVTRMVKRFQFLHSPEAPGAYRAQAKAVDEDSFAGGAATLEDTTPVERRYIVGAIVSGTGVLDRRTGVISVTFTNAVPFGEAGAAPVGAETLLSPASLDLLGPGAVRVAWANPRTVLLTLPPARESNLCAAWRAVRETALALALRENRPDVPVRLWTDPQSVRLPSEMTVSWRAPEEWYDVSSGFQMEETASVYMSDARNDEADVVIAGARVFGGCQAMSLRAVARDGSWDGVARWGFDSARVSAGAEAIDGVPTADALSRLNQIVAETNLLSRDALLLDPSETSPGLTYRFNANLTDCAGWNSTATADAVRVAGAVPFVYPTSGRFEYASAYSSSFTIEMETRVPDVQQAVSRFGSSCDVDVGELIYVWTNLTGAAECLYADRRSAVFSGFERAPRATRRTLTIPPFCLVPRSEPHAFELYSAFGSGSESPASRTEVFLTVTRSPLAASVAGASGPRVITRGAIGLGLDASASFDPDADAPNEKSTRPTFTWSCGIVKRPYAPTVPDASQTVSGLEALRAGEGEGCGAAVTDRLALARGDPSVPDDVSSVLEFDTLYRFTVRYADADRAANASTLVHVVPDPVPTVTLQTPSETWASSVALRLSGSVAKPPSSLDSSEGTITVSWSSVPAIDFTNRASFLTPTDATSLAIAPGVLLPGQKYAFTLIASSSASAAGAAKGYATTRTVEIIGPPAVGTISAFPQEGFELDTEFLVSTSGWGGGGALLYSIGYVTRGVGGEDAEVFLTRRLASSEARGKLPSDADSGDGLVRVFAYAEVPGGGGAVARAETTVRVEATPRERVTAKAGEALDASNLLEDIVARAAYATSACAAMNPPARNVSAPVSVLTADELAIRRAIRASAMASAIASVDLTLGIVDEDPTAVLDPDLVAGLIVSISTVAAVPEELAAATAAAGIEKVAALLRAPTTRALRTNAVVSAVALFDVGLKIVALGDSDDFDGSLDFLKGSDAASTGASRRRRKGFRRALSQHRDVSSSFGFGTENVTFSAENDTDASRVTAAMNPLSAMSLDGATVASRAIVRGRVANETIPTMFGVALSVSARRAFPSDLFREDAPVRMDHRRAATYAFPTSVATALASSRHVDVSLYRVDGASVPSDARAVSDACAVDVRDDAGRRAAPAPEEEIVSRVPLLGSGLLELEKVVYQYRCARHVGGVWVSDDPGVRTGDAVESSPGSGIWHVECFGSGATFLGYLVGVIIVPLSFSDVSEETRGATTASGYWYLMAFTAISAVVFGACALRIGMRRYAVKLANSDNAEANKP